MTTFLRLQVVLFLVAQSALAGEGLYQEYCASCHGAELQGQPNWRVPNDDGTLPAPPHDASGHTWHHDDQMLFEYTKLGGQAYLDKIGVSGFTSAMPGFGDDLTDAEIESILSFIKSSWPEHIQAAQAERTKQLN